MILETIQQAKDYLRKHIGKGVECPACGQFVKLYRRKLNSGMAANLIKFYRLQNASGGDWVHISALHQTRPTITSNDYPYLRYWGLIEEKTKDSSDDTKKNSGFWRVTDKGKQFVLGKIAVKSHIYLYDGKPRKIEDDEMKSISIEDALGNKFHYGELMS